MDLFQVIRHFSAYEDVPIEPSEVKKFILSDGMDLVIRFLGVELDIEIVRGHLAQYVKPAAPYGEDTNIADVYYATNQGTDWIRLVCVKEMTHVFDVEVARTSTKDDVETLIKRLALAPEFQDLQLDAKEGGPKVLSDRLAVFYALAITFPWAARELILPKLKDNTLNEDDVARLVDLPLRYVRLVLSEQWDELYPLLLPS